MTKCLPLYSIRAMVFLSAAKPTESSLNVYTLIRGPHKHPLTCYPDMHALNYCSCKPDSSNSPLSTQPSLGYHSDSKSERSQTSSTVSSTTCSKSHAATPPIPPATIESGPPESSTTADSAKSPGTRPAYPPGTGPLEILPRRNPIITRITVQTPPRPTAPPPSSSRNSTTHSALHRPRRSSRLATLPRSGSTSRDTYPPRPATPPTSYARHSTTYSR